MTWASSITMGSCPECGCGGCAGCTGAVSNPATLHVTFTITNPGIWDVVGSDWGCSDVSGNRLTWDGIMPNDGNCVLDLTSYCPFALSIPPYVFDYSWFNGKTFVATLDGTGCQYNLFAECTATDSAGGVYHTQLSMTIILTGPGSVTYNLSIGGVYDYPPNPASVTRSVSTVPLTWGCSGSSFTSASGSFNFNSPGPSNIPYGTSGYGGTVAGSFVVTP